MIFSEKTTGSTPYGVSLPDSGPAFPKNGFALQSIALRQAEAALETGQAGG
jgi:hypothetical protein